MRRVIDWFRSWSVGANVSRQLYVSNRRLQNLDTRCSRLAIQLDRKQKKFNRTIEQLQSRFDSDVERLDVELSNARRIYDQYESALEEVRETNTVLEVTIQTLTASHKLLMERYDAEISCEVRRKTVASTSE